MTKRFLGFDSQKRFGKEISTRLLTVPKVRLRYGSELIPKEKTKNMIKPLNDYVLLEKASGEKKVGSIILTSEKKTANLGTIVALGEGKKDDKGVNHPIEGLKAGDKVVYREYSGTDYEENVKKFLLIKDEDILAVVE